MDWFNIASILTIVMVYLIVGIILFFWDCSVEQIDDPKGKLKMVLFMLPIIFIITIVSIFTNHFNNKEYDKIREKILTNKYIPYEVVYDMDGNSLKSYRPNKIISKDGYVLSIDDYYVKHYKIQKENLQKYDLMVLNGNLFILDKEIKIKISENQIMTESFDVNDDLTTFTLLAETYNISNAKIPLKISYDSRYKYFSDLDLKIGETYGVLEREKNLSFVERLYEILKEYFK